MHQQFVVCTNKQSLNTPPSHQ